MLKESGFAKNVFKARKLLNDGIHSLDNICKYIDNEDKESAVEESFRYVRHAEKIANSARLLPVVSGTLGAPDIVDEIIIDENNPKVEYTAENWFHVIIPALLPKKEHGNPTYIRTITQLALKNYFLNNEKKVFNNDVVLIFQHTYSKDNPERRVRDHDNIELNAVVDAIALHVLKDDSALICNHFYCTEIGEEDKTDVFVVPKHEFIVWLFQRGYT